MLGSKIKGLEEAEKQILDDIQTLVYSLPSGCMGFDTDVERIEMQDSKLEYSISKEAFDRRREIFNDTMDQIWGNYEKLRELGVLKIVQAHE